MKPIILFAIFLALASCNQQTQKMQAMQDQIDSLQIELRDSYKPGFGEFMSNVQSHHAKLWFAGKNQNWKLADFEIHEIIETVEDIQKYETDREESKEIGMINPALDSVNAAIEKKDLGLFESSFTNLTNTCNNCHHRTNFEFNVVKIPEEQTFSNQVFKVQ